MVQLHHCVPADELLPYLRNSVLVTLLATIGHVLSCSLIGYGFARYSFPLKRTLFVFVVLSIIVPTQSIIIRCTSIMRNSAGSTATCR